MELTLESLGLTTEELQDRVVDAFVERIFSTRTVLGDLENKTREAINAAVEKIAAEHLLPNVTQYIEGVVLQQTNKWGEKVGGPVTFIEYLTQRADAYMREEVDYEGKTKDECNFSFNKRGTRIAHMINKHLYISIETAMKQALATANSAIAGGITDTVKIQLTEILKSIQISAAPKR